MKRVLLPLLLATGVALAAPKVGSSVTIRVMSAKVMKSPKFIGPTAGSVSRGDQLTVKEVKGDWYRVEGSYAGWRTLVLTVADNKVTYYVDGQLFSEHSSAVYPEDFMSINFNLWFMPKGADGSLGPVDSPEMREYQEDINWVFFQEGVALSTADVEAQVADLRGKKVAHIDNVKEQNPVLPSPCGL